MREKLKCPNCNERFSIDPEQTISEFAIFECPKCHLSSTLSQLRLFSSPPQAVASTVQKKSESSGSQHAKSLIEHPLEKIELTKESFLGCGCLMFLVWFVAYVVFNLHGCVGSALQQHEKFKLDTEARAKQVEQQEAQQKLEEAEFEKRWALEQANQKRLEEQRLADAARNKKADDQRRSLNYIRSTPPDKTMLECAFYLKKYEPRISKLANESRNAWQEAVFDGNLPLMNKHYQELNSLLGREFLGLYWDIDDIMRDERKIKKILAESEEYRRKNQR